MAFRHRCKVTIKYFEQKNIEYYFGLTSMLHLHKPSAIEIRIQFIKTIAANFVELFHDLRQINNVFYKVTKQSFVPILQLCVVYIFTELES